MKKSNTILFVIVLAVNLVLVWGFKINITFQQVLTIHTFLFTLSLLAQIIQVKFSGNKKITPAHFLIMNFLRIFLCILFLLPTILQYNNSEDVYIYNFFIIYFIYLFYGIIFNPKNYIKINM